MSPAPSASARRRRGLTLVELLIALTITAMTALATASMLLMVSQSSTQDRESRSVVMRAHAAQSRLKAYLDPALCVLQQSLPKNALAVWLQDLPAPGMVNLSEIRVIWYDPSARTLTMERVQFPDSWPQITRDQADTALPAGSDFIAAVEAQRALGYTTTQQIARDVWSATWVMNNGSKQAVTSATRVRLEAQIGVNSSTATTVFVASGMANRATPTQ